MVLVPLNVHSYHQCFDHHQPSRGAVRLPQASCGFSSSGTLPFFTIFHHFHNFYHFYFQFEQVFLSQNSWNLVTLYPLVNPQLSSSVSLPRTSICPAMNLYPGSVSWYHGICQCWSLCSKNSYREHMLCAVLILILTIHLFQIFHIVTMMHIM